MPNHHWKVIHERRAASRTDGLLNVDQMWSPWREEKLDAAMTGACARCAWTTEGTAREVILAQRAHRKEHGAAEAA